VVCVTLINEEQHMAGRVGTGKTGTGSDKRLRDEATLVCQHQQQLGLPGFCDADRWSRPIGDPVRLWRTYALVFLPTLVD
jgi:hypothetical protein